MGNPSLEDMLMLMFFFFFAQIRMGHDYKPCTVFVSIRNLLQRVDILDDILAVLSKLGVYAVHFLLL